VPDKEQWAIYRTRSQSLEYWNEETRSWGWLDDATLYDMPNRHHSEPVLAAIRSGGRFTRVTTRRFNEPEED
jgi:hypothetical protein